MKTSCALKILYRLREAFPKERTLAEQILKELAKLIEQKDKIP